MNIAPSESFQVADPHAIPLRVLVLDDEPTTVAMLSRVLTTNNMEVLPARTIREAASHLSAAVPDVAIIDVFLGQDDGLQFVRAMRQRSADSGIVVISGEDTETLANKALNSGADAFLSKPIVPAALLLTVRRLHELRQQRQRAVELENELRKRDRETLFPEILTHSDLMKSVLRLIEKVAPRDLSVMIFGESGTGKELVARAIHQNSSRTGGRFVELNCAALPANLVESELFGHEKGAFTGAVAARAGRIEMADKGTLFLDEIGELPLEIQPKLLRALQEKRITRVGGKKDIDCDFRLVSATHRDLQAEVRAGRFREDLYYRVAVFPIKLPPLRDRLEDLDLLLSHFLKQEDIRDPHIAPTALAMLRNYQWPGNVRELKNFAQAVTLFTDKGVIDEASVRQYFGSRMGDTPPMGPLQQLVTPVLGMRTNYPPVPPPVTTPAGRRAVRRLEDLEREEITYALHLYKGSVPEAAMALGMGRATLYKYLKRHGIDLGQFTKG